MQRKVTGTYHCEATMHDEDHGAAGNQPAAVNSIGDLHLPGVDGGNGRSVAGSPGDSFAEGLRRVAACRKLSIDGQADIGQCRACSSRHLRERWHVSARIEWSICKV